MKKNTKGKSIKTTKVDELKNSRSVSNSRMVPAMAPVFCLCSLGVKVRILSNKRLEISRSAFFEAVSINLARKLLIRKSNPRAIITPILKAINDSNAPFGIILSYTVIVKSAVVSDKKLDTIAAIITWA